MKGIGGEMMDKYEYWFACLQGIGSVKKRKLREGMKSAQALYYIEEIQLVRYGLSEKERQLFLESICSWKLDEEYQKMLEKGVNCTTIMEADYPKRLAEISAAPYALYWKGELPQNEIPSVAIVGARDCTTYGEVKAREFAQALASAGVQIISGMANGIDSVSQKSGLEVGGKSYGVLGSGVDICYPREQVELYICLQEQGGVISEFPLGSKPLPQHFPARNRIISGLSDIVLVIEAREKSGSLITADMALEQGKDVYALPGPIDSPLSRGCNCLIKQGAGVLLSPEELLEELGLFCEKIAKKNLLLETEENIVYSCLGFHPKNMEQLLRETRLPVEEVLRILLRLELMGVAKEISKNNYVKMR